MHATGSFHVTVHPEPPFDLHEGVGLSRVSVDKRFEGPLAGTSTVHMLAARGTVEGAGGYVAIERIKGTLEGRAGSFVVLHVGTMSSGSQAIDLRISPGSGTGELAGIEGTMQIHIAEGKHAYAIDYTLA